MDITYGPGGYFPDLPGGNLIETIEHHGDGKATRTTYEPGSEKVLTEETIDVEVPEVVDDGFVSRAALVAAIESAPDDVAGLRAALIAALTG